MRFSTIAACLAAASSALSSSLPPRDYDEYDYYALHIEPTRSPSDVASFFGLELEGQLGELDHHYLFRTHKHDQDIVKSAVQEHKSKRRRDPSYSHDLLDGILLHQKQKLRPPHEKRGSIPHYVDLEGRQAPSAQTAEDPGAPPVDLELEAAKQKGIDIAKSLDIRDPIFPEQWHLYNPVQRGHDLNVSGVWSQGITGKGSIVCIVDDGLDMDSEDLKDNYWAPGSYDFNDKGPDPRPRLSDDRHGTRCAGEVSAVRNNVCGVGVAYDSKIAGIRILSKPITDADEAVALMYGYNETQIYSCSWGPPDDGQEMGEPGVLIKRAMVQAVQKGRKGLGSIYVFAAGNGAASDDNCNFDGYTNSIYSVTVGAIDREGTHPYYSEKCSAQLVVTYSSGNGDAIHTTDVGANACYANHGGTSAAGPLAVGIFALVLEIRPDLTWRDIQWLTVNAAVPLEQDSDWQDTPYGKKFSHQFGYGKLDAWQLVEAAKTHKVVKPQAWYKSPWQHVRQDIPQGAQGLASTVRVTQDNLTAANLETVEHVTVTMNVEHTRRGDISVELRSPSGIVSHLSTPRMHDNFRGGYDDWTFMSVAHWGESGLGNWTIIVKDTKVNIHNGTFVDWKLMIFGESADASIQELLPLPSQHDDDDHDREDADFSHTSIELPTSTAPPMGNPSDHQDRPINQKPADDKPEDEEVQQSPATTAAPGASTTLPFDKPIQATPVPSKGENLLPSFFPNFGVSKRTQIWIYGAIGLMVTFCIGLAIFFWTAARKRKRALARENYEFEMIEDEDEAEGKRGSKKGRRRAGELYDAFAGESDDEVFSDMEDEEEERYRDEKMKYEDEKARLSSGSEAVGIGSGSGGK